ncbi:MAG: hypothetical protein J4F30_05210 [Acidobacteria bacterium]|nr:hypothetical protein [Acidobacteriota bacterium]
MLVLVSPIGWLLIGALLGLLFIGFARRLHWRNQVRLFAVCLFLAGALYLAFGAFHGLPWSAVEGAGFVIFSLLAYAGLRWPRLLALGWLLHAGWDGGLHLALEQPVIGPWLPLLCLPYDAMVAAYLAYADNRQRAV